MRSLADILEEAYVLFAPYTLGTTLDVCKVCCVTEAEEQALLAAPLREASAEPRILVIGARQLRPRTLGDEAFFATRIGVG